MASQLDTIPATDEVNIAHNFIDIAIGSIINSILFNYRFDEVWFQNNIILIVFIKHRKDEFYKLKSILNYIINAEGKLWFVLVIMKPSFFGKLPVLRAKFADYKSTFAEL